MALVQMSVTGGDKRRNLARAEELIAEAAAHGSRLVVLPEAMDLGWTHPSSRTAAEPIPHGEPCRRLAESAACHGIFLCAGLTERCGDHVFNSAVILGKSGELLCFHRKINELEIGHPFYAQGDRLNVAGTELGTLGLMICADGFAKDHVLSRSLCYMGADILLSPSAWAVPADHDNQTDPYGAIWKELLSTGRAGVLRVDRRGQQRRAHQRRTVGRAKVHRMLAGGWSRRSGGRSRALWRRCRDDSLRRCQDRETSSSRLWVDGILDQCVDKTIHRGPTVSSQRR
jgi:predicted amidohydrolase